MKTSLFKHQVYSNVNNKMQKYYSRILKYLQYHSPVNVLICIYI